MKRLPLVIALAGCAHPQEHEHHHAGGHHFEHADDWAKTFDDPARDASQHPKEVIDAMAITPGMSVADIGAGTGYFEPWLSRAVGPSGAVYAVDVEPDMVRYLRERAVREKLDNVHAALAAPDDAKLPPSSVDRILIVDTWHHITDREHYAQKLRASLKPGGKIVIVDFTLEAKHGPPPDHRVRPEQVVRELTAAGLASHTIASTLPDQYIAVGE